MSNFRCLYKPKFSYASNVRMNNSQEILTQFTQMSSSTNTHSNAGTCKFKPSFRSYEIKSMNSAFIDLRLKKSNDCLEGQNLWIDICKPVQNNFNESLPESNKSSTGAEESIDIIEAGLIDEEEAKEGVTSRLINNIDKLKRLKPAKANQFDENGHMIFQCSSNIDKKFERWGKKEDRQVYKKLREQVPAYGMTLQEFFSLDFTSNRAIQSVILNLSVETNWNRTPQKLFERMQRITESAMKNNEEFSRRDLKFLRRLIKQSLSSGTLDYEELLYYFPGKSAERIKGEVKEYLTGYYSRDKKESIYNNHELMPKYSII